MNVCIDAGNLRAMLGAWRSGMY